MKKSKLIYLMTSYKDADSVGRLMLTRQIHYSLLVNVPALLAIFIIHVYATGLKLRNNLKQVLTFHLFIGNHLNVKSARKLILVRIVRFINSIHSNHQILRQNLQLS